MTALQNRVEPSPNESSVIEFNSRQKPTANLTKGIGVLVALNKIQQALIEQGGIGKNQRTKSNNANFQYSYRGIDDLYNAISPLMITYGLICIPHVESWSSKQFLSSKGDITFKTFVLVRYTFLSTSDGSSFEASLAGESNDSGDKGLSKALSMAQKYLFLQTFSIPTETDHDPDRYPSEPMRTHVAPQLASLEFKNEVDSRMRTYNNKLCDVLKARGLDMATLTTDQLKGVYADFKIFIQQDK